MTKWRYFDLTCRPEDEQNRLDDMGRNCWEAWHMEGMTSPDGMGGYLFATKIYFKTPVPIIERDPLADAVRAASLQPHTQSGVYHSIRVINNLDLRDCTTAAEARTAIIKALDEII